jgi:radical SAM protein with 4Fe4S-binding SPASM domain
VLGNEKILVNSPYIHKLEFALSQLSNSSCVNMEWHGNKTSINISANHDFLMSKTYDVPINTRAANLSNNLLPRPSRRSGKLRCDRHLYSNVLLPNGDVTICCQDFGIKHVVGNLLDDTYEDLFKSSEFIRIQKGLDDENADTLCRQCEYALNASDVY